MKGLRGFGYKYREIHPPKITGTFNIHPLEYQLLTQLPASKTMSDTLSPEIEGRFTTH
jgi:hypothetical protein